MFIWNWIIVPKYVHENIGSCRAQKQNGSRETEGIEWVLRHTVPIARIWRRRGAVVFPLYVDRRKPRRPPGEVQSCPGITRGRRVSSSSRQKIARSEKLQKRPHVSVHLREPRYRIHSKLACADIFPQGERWKENSAPRIGFYSHRRSSNSESVRICNPGCPGWRESRLEWTFIFSRYGDRKLAAISQSIDYLSPLITAPRSITISCRWLECVYRSAAVHLRPALINFEIAAKTTRRRLFQQQRNLRTSPTASTRARHHSRLIIFLLFSLVLSLALTQVSSLHVIELYYYLYLIKVDRVQSIYKK